MPVRTGTKPIALSMPLLALCKINVLVKPIPGMPVPANSPVAAVAPVVLITTAKVSLKVPTVAKPGTISALQKALVLPALTATLMVYGTSPSIILTSLRMKFMLPYTVVSINLQMVALPGKRNALVHLDLILTTPMWRSARMVLYTLRLATKVPTEVFGAALMAKHGPPLHLPD